MPEPAPVTIATLSARRMRGLHNSQRARRADHVRSRCSIPIDAAARLRSAAEAVALAPAEAVLGARARLVLAADPARIAEPIERVEHRRVAHLALVRLRARRHRGDLHMADHG